MGEVLEFGQFEEEDKQQKKTDSGIQKKIDSAIITDTAGLLKAGKSRNGAKLLLKEQGYTLGDAEKIVSQAELITYAKPKTNVNFPLIFLAVIVALAVLGIGAFLVMGVTSGPLDCGEDTFCVQKMIGCESGQYISSYRGVTNLYDINNRGRFCQIFVRVGESESTKFEAGMSMNCLYPIKDGKTDQSAGYSFCDGSLASALQGS